MKACPKCGFEIKDKKLEYCPNCQISFEGYQLKEIKEKLSSDKEKKKKKVSFFNRKIIIYLAAILVFALILLTPILIYQIYKYRNITKKKEIGLNISEPLNQRPQSNGTTDTQTEQPKINIEEYMSTGKQIESDIDQVINQNEDELDPQIMERLINWDLKLLDAIQKNPGVEDGDKALFYLYDINLKTYKQWQIGYENAKTALEMVEKYYDEPINRVEVNNKLEELEELKNQTE